METNMLLKKGSLHNTHIDIIILIKRKKDVITYWNMRDEQPKTNCSTQATKNFVNYTQINLLKFFFLFFNRSRHVNLSILWNIFVLGNFEILFHLITSFLSFSLSFVLSFFFLSSTSGLFLAYLLSFFDYKTPSIYLSIYLFLSFFLI